jgi:predicted alpha/beta hydrolase
VSAAPPEAVRFSARDGRELHGLRLRAPSPRGALLINGATGFLREFYLRFARYCAGRGYHTLVYDYRGMGACARQPLAAEPARMSEWARLDMPGALDALARLAPQLPLFILGHSVGGQLLGAMDNAARARALVMIACSTGYWRRQRVPFRYLAYLFWQLWGPWQLRRHGFVPRGFIWRGEALPPEVFRQWRRWCLDPSSVGPELDPDLTDSRFEALQVPLLNWGFSDDPIATPTAVAALLVSYRGARLERRWTRPREVGARVLGHHGFFSERHRETLWRGALDWLDAHH